MNTLPDVPTAHSRLTSKGKDRLQGQPLFLMKKHTVIFVISLLLLLIAEYLFFTELYAQRRPFILAASLLITAACTWAAVRTYRLISGPPSH